MKNIKFSKLIIASTLAISLVACGQKTTEESLVSANRFIQSGKTDAAIIELKNAVSQAPEDGPTRIMLAKLYFETGQLDAAEKELKKAQELNKSADEVLLLLSQVYYYSEQYDAVVNLSDKDIKKPEVLSTVNLMRYLASLRNTSTNNRLELEEVPSNLSSRDKLLADAYSAFRAGNETLIFELLAELENREIRPIDTVYLQAMFSYQKGDYTAAAESFGKVKQLMPFPNSVSFQWIESLIKSKQFDEAEKQTDDLIKINKEQPLLNLYKANIAYEKQNYDSALSFSEKAIQNGVDSLSARIIAGVSAYKLESLEKAYVHLINATSRSNFQNDDVQRLLVHVQLSLGYSEEAAQSLKNLVDLNSQDAQLFAQTGMKLAVLGDVSSANEFLGMANKLNDENANNKFWGAMVNIGTDEKAVIEGLKTLLDKDPAVSQGWMQLAMAYVRSGDEKAALEVASRWAESEPFYGKALEGVVYFNTNNITEAIRALKEALLIEPRQMGAHQYLLQAYEKLGMNEELFAQAQQVLSFAPDNILALLAVVKVGRAADKREQAESFLKKLVDQDKSNISVYVALAMSAKLHNEFEEVKTILTPHKKQLDSLGLMLLGDAYLQLGQPDLALSTYQTWKANSPNTLTPYVRIIGLSELKGDNEEALQLTEEALKQFPRRPALLMLKVNFLTKLQQFSLAQQVIDEIKKAEGNKSDRLLAFYEGQLALSQKDYPKAEMFLTKHYKNSASFTTAMLLAKAMQGNGHVAAASEVLNFEVSKLSAPPASVLRTVAEFYLYNAMYDKAAEQYTKLMELEGETAASLNNLAYLLQQVKKLEQAREMANRAAVLAPNSPSVLDTLGWIEYDLGNFAEAYKNLNSALKLAPNSNAIMLHMAQVQISLGQISQAKALLNKLSKPTKKQQEQRRVLLNTI